MQIQECIVTLSKAVFCWAGWVSWAGWEGRGGCGATMPSPAETFGA